MKPLRKVIEETERKYLLKLMRESSNHTTAAQVAGITRVQLFRLLDKHYIPRKPRATEGPC